MKKRIGLLLLAFLAGLIFTGCMSAEPISTTGGAFEGEYALYFIYEDGITRDLDLFIIKKSGVIAGEVDDGGWTQFTGTVNEDGTFECKMSTAGVGGGFWGTIDAEGNITGESNVHNEYSKLGGEKLK